MYTGYTSDEVSFFVRKEMLPSEGGYPGSDREINRLMEVPRMRVKITLACTECKQRNYKTMKDKKNTPDRLEMKKYCPFCKKHTVHTETK